MAWSSRQFTLDADAVHDTALGVRMLLKTPGFTAIALLVFAIGIGTTTAIVSVADALFMRPLPVPQPERVLTVWQFNRETGTGEEEVAPANALDWMRARSFEAVAIADPRRLYSTSLDRQPETLLVIAGIVVALPLTQLLRAMLFGITSTDPVTFQLVSMALVFVAAAACSVPASRAIKVDPVEALRIN